jgi:hypothetical protein
MAPNTVLPHEKEKATAYKFGGKTMGYGQGLQYIGATKLKFYTLIPTPI